MGLTHFYFYVRHPRRSQRTYSSSKITPNQSLCRNASSNRPASLYLPTTTLNTHLPQTSCKVNTKAVVRFGDGATTKCMEQHKKDIEKLIDLYLQDKASPKEKQLLDKWMQSMDVTNGEEYPLGETHKMALKKRIERVIKPQQARIIPLWKKPWAIAAASLLVILFLGLYYFNSLDRTPLLSSNPSSPKTESSLRVIYAHESDTSFYLADRSRVELKSGSRLSWEEPFITDQRIVRLEGKAFFEVAKDTERPFSVYTRDIITTALGTSFWIDNNPDKERPNVVLVTGKVSIRQQIEGREIILAYLTPGQKWGDTPIKPDTENRIASSHATSKKRTQESKKLDFHHTPLTEVLPLLEKHYTASITFDPALLEGMSFYGSYDGDTEIEDILKTIAIANDLILEYENATKTYTITTAKN